MSRALLASVNHETAAKAAVHLLQSSHQVPPVWLAAPFLLLLIMIATAPLFYPHFWERHYIKVSFGLGSIVAAYYWFIMKDGYILRHSLEDYISFIALIAALFVVAGGIFIRIDRKGSPLLNSTLLVAGALLSNFIGTTGASMLLIRPYIRINEGRMKAFHIVFFIFIVSNIGGALTPIGDPPLFLGFLKGVPFFWVFSKLWMPWLFTIGGLILIFMVLDSRAGKGKMTTLEKSGKVTVIGAESFLFLAIVIGAVFLDPAVIPGFPSFQHMFHLPFGIRELILFIVAFVAYKTANKEALRGNEFNFLPIREVAILFMGIFATMIPVLELVGAYSSAHATEFTVARCYWLTGALSGFLDNAPTYLNFLAAAAGKFGMNSNTPADIQKIAYGLSSAIHGDVTSDIYLMAISLASVFFGSLTYIGNAPNFMVKNIASQSEVEVPGFLEYIYKYSIPVLIPFFTLIWWMFFKY